jgi:O-antigen/teichoic acid export membrane protein
MQTRIATNTLWNLVATAAPMPVALYTIPVLIAGLGKDRFVPLALAWTLIGYFTLFDLGLGRALTQMVSSEGWPHVGALKSRSQRCNARPKP